MTLRRSHTGASFDITMSTAKNSSAAAIYP